MDAKLACTYLRLPLSSPVIVGACALTLQPETLRHLIACGAGAVVLPSIFQEQVEFGDQQQRGQQSAAPADSLQQQQDQYNSGPEQYLASIGALKRVSSIPIIASLSGCSGGDWLSFARQMEASGADALELNLQPVASDPLQTSAELEAGLCDAVRTVCRSVAIPVAVKLTQHFTSITNLAHQLKQAGAAGVVLFGHESKWEVEIDRLRWTVHWELTPVDSLGSTLAGLVRAHLAGLGLSIAASGGVRTAEDAIKTMIAGAHVVMVTSEIYRSGPEAISRIVAGLERYLAGCGCESLSQFQRRCPQPEARCGHLLRQQNYLDPLTRSAHYKDPTPAIPPQAGDRYGHQD